MTKIAVIIPTINRKEKLRRCLVCLQKQSYKDIKIYVVNNSSTDGTEDLLKNEFPEVTALNFKQMLGSAGGYKKGLERANKDGYDWFWLMDDDAWVAKNTLEILIKDSKLDSSKVFASVAMDEKKTGELAWINELLVDDGSKKTVKVYRDLGDKDLVKSAGIGYLGLLIPREVIDKVGYPDESMFAWVDDVDYFIRIRKAGFPMYYVRNSIIYHPQPNYREVNLLFKKVQIVDAAPWKEYFALRNSIYVWLKYNSRFITLFFKIPKQIILHLYTLIFYKDKKLIRLKYYCLAFYHGITLKMGLTLIPDNS